MLPAFSAACRTGIGRSQCDRLKQEDRDGPHRHRARPRLEHVEGAPLRSVGRRRDNQGRQGRATQSVEDRRRDDQVANHEEHEGWLAEQLHAADVLARCWSWTYLRLASAGCWPTTPSSTSRKNGG